MNRRRVASGVVSDLPVGRLRAAVYGFSLPSNKYA